MIPLTSRILRGVSDWMPNPPARCDPCHTDRRSDHRDLAQTCWRRLRVFPPRPRAAMPSDWSAWRWPRHPSGRAAHLELLVKSLSCVKGITTLADRQYRIHPTKPSVSSPHTVTSVKIAAFWLTPRPSTATTTHNADLPAQLRQLKLCATAEQLDDILARAARQRLAPYLLRARGTIINNETIDACESRRWDSKSFLGKFFQNFFLFYSDFRS